MEGILRSANERASQASFKQSPRKVTAVDEELEELLTKQKAVTFLGDCLKLA